jgi:hypothetical protein
MRAKAVVSLGAGVIASLLAFAPPAAPDARSALEAQPKGWVDITPGARLEGWTRVPIKSDLHRDVEVWKIDRKAGLIHCDGQLPAGGGAGKDGSHEMLRYDRELGDFLFHVEWRFVDPQRTGWNSGVFARTSADATIWHQAQTGNASGGYWFGDTPDESGNPVRRKVDAREMRVKPAGEWNTFEITARGDKLSLWANGAVVSEWEGLRVRRGHIGVEAEFHQVEFRNLKLKELK